MKLANLLKEDVQTVNEVTTASGFEKARQAMSNMADMYMKAKRLRNSVTKSFESESAQYKRGKWDVIDLRHAGDKRWDGPQKTMENDILNFYNAKIKDIWVQSLKFDEKTGQPQLIIGVNASGDNVSGDAYYTLESISIVPGYTSEEGKEYKQGYGKNQSRGGIAKLSAMPKRR